MISGSMAFAKEMFAVKKELEKEGHVVYLPHTIELNIDDDKLVENLDQNFLNCIENDTMRRCFQQVADSDAVVVLNYPKNNINGYIGTSTLMEMGIAYFMHKNIFVLFPYPSDKEVRWAHEVRIMQPTILHGDLSKIVVE